MKYRIAIVEYLNTLPFSEGFKLSGLETAHEIIRVTPAQCALLYKQGRVDISLCPVGALDDVSEHDIVGKYCIGADGAVKTVMLMSKVPLKDIKAVRLDDQSRTSNVLLQILAQRYWKKDWSFYTEDKNGSTESCLLIGDKVFENIAYYPYQYDLASAWKALTGLPMVFAVWIARPGIPVTITDQLDEAFEKGMQLIMQNHLKLEKWQYDYLLQNISYPFDARKREALALYNTWVDALATLSPSR